MVYSPPVIAATLGGSSAIFSSTLAFQGLPQDALWVRPALMLGLQLENLGGELADLPKECDDGFRAHQATTRDLQLQAAQLVLNIAGAVLVQVPQEVIDARHSVV